MSLLQILKDYSPLVSPILSPIIAAVTTIFLFQRKEKERVHCSLEWRYVPHPDGQYEEPFLVVHNRSDRSVAIKDLRFLTGMLWRKRSDNTALGYDDPENIDFPYLVEPGRLHNIRLDEYQATRLADETSWLVHLLSRVGRAR
ncbi:MAG: hypothetical protein JF604_19060, partial [Bradyrhizobium sp.]|nr:hypothetical protein [Bradyrhizobium sp.]